MGLFQKQCAASALTQENKMAGVVDKNGIQWERCNACAGWVKIQDLLYERPSEAHEYGRDLCITCATKPLTNSFFALPSEKVGEIVQQQLVTVSIPKPLQLYCPKPDYDLCYIDTLGGESLVMVVYLAGDCNTFKWPFNTEFRTEEKQRLEIIQALYDDRECGRISADCNEAILPDGTKITF
jgi:hypothetical protein